MMVNVNMLLGKTVVGDDARLIGNVTGVEVELLPKWQITHIHVSLTEETTRELGYKKPFLGSVEVLIPISIVKAVGDIISLDKKTLELKDIVEPTRK
jgi:sporulation protein YlmC with PRC-barrel domain